MGIITKPYTFASGNAVDGTQINANFDPLYTQVNAATGNITPAAQTVLDDTTVAAMLATLGAAPSATAVVGPASSTDNAIVRFDAATGKLVQNSAVTIDDSGRIIGKNSLWTQAANGATALAMFRFTDTAPTGNMFGLLNNAANDWLYYVDVEGNLWTANNCSALSFTDRTPHYEGDALAELIKIKGKDGKIDHSTLPTFARHVTKLQVASETEKDKDGKALMVETQEEGRDLGAMISMLTVAIKQLNDRLLAIEKKGN